MKRLVVALSVLMLSGCATLERLEQEFKGAEMSTPVYASHDLNRNLRVAPGIGLAYTRETRQVNTGRMAAAERQVQADKEAWAAARKRDQDRVPDKPVMTDEQKCASIAELVYNRAMQRALETGDYTLVQKYEKSKVYNECLKADKS